MNAFDGMTARQSVAMVKKVMKNEKRWNTTAEGKEAALEVVERAIADENVHISTRIKAVDCLLKMEAQNQMDERISLGLNEENQRQPQMVLLLPANGTEVSSAAAEGPIEAQWEDVGESGEELAAVPAEPEAQ